MRIVLHLVFVLSGLWSAASYSSNALAAEENQSTDQRAEFFREKVEPIFVGKCLECHAAEKKGELDLRNRKTALAGGESGVVIRPDRPDESLLYRHVRDGEMPPKDPLSKEQIAVLQRWIADGAYFPEQPLDLFSATTEHRAGYDWWSLRPLRQDRPPQISSSSKRGSVFNQWRQNPIDRFVAAKLQAKGLDPSPPASPSVLIRRASYDLIGLPPTTGERRDFLDACARETGSSETVGQQAYRRLIDRLLASPRYGEHWGRHWLDVVRYGESAGFEQNFIIENVWPFRDYVIRSFNEDIPFDRFFVEHLAGDIVGGEDRAAIAGTIFLVCGPYDSVGNQDKAAQRKIRAGEIDEMIRATSETFLGLTVGCARCHDHKFDPISQRDYYSMFASLRGVRHGSRIVASKEKRKQRARLLATLNTQKAELLERVKQMERAILNKDPAEIAKIEAQWTRPKTSLKQTEESFSPVSARYVRLVVLGVSRNAVYKTGFLLDEFEVWTAGTNSRNVALARNGGVVTGGSRQIKDFADAYSVNHVNDGLFNARWQAIGNKLTVKLATEEIINRVAFSTNRTGAPGQERLDIFPCEYRIEVSRDGKSWREIANAADRVPIDKKHRKVRLLRQLATETEAKQLRETRIKFNKLGERINNLPKLESWWIGDLRQPKDKTYVFLGGDPERKGDAVVPASIKTIHRAAASYALAADTPESKRRLALAQWIVANDNPLTPRVLVNRLWHYHFGSGIVNTPSDFGFMGGRPSHPALLDWLARRLHQVAWRIKPLHAEIMLSQAYRQSSLYRAQAAAIDGEGRLLWRFPPRRLSSDELRDTMLETAGKLQFRMGGYGFRLYHYFRDNVSSYTPLEKHGPETYRRAVYHQPARAAQVDLLADFDGPDCAFATPRRSSTTTPLQALTLMNHSFTIDMAGFLADRLRKESELRPRVGDAEVAMAEDDVLQSKYIRLAFERLYGRPPSREEIQAGSSLIERFGLRAFCRAMLNSSELIYIN